MPGGAHTSFFFLLSVSFFGILPNTSCASSYAAFSRRPAARRVQLTPQGPRLVGSLHHVLLSCYGDLPHRALRELAGRHGPLMLLRFGAVPTLVMSSAEAAREVLKTHDAAFASRHLTPTLALRRVCVLELFSACRVQSFRHIREDEAACLLRSVSEEFARSGDAGAVVESGEGMSRMINNVVVRSAVGNRCPRRDEFLREIDESVKYRDTEFLREIQRGGRRTMCGPHLS
ncbi:zealexin A1 synthase-like [Aegilops tauschii subsp. strangulata]|uniref:zealexin A1 synthase-like n=1 Tax=Aegilops tauschii subsp. strangulata TaxID=200361 RepID=UPI000989DE21